MIVRVLQNISRPEYNLVAGQIVDMPSAEAKRVVAMTDTFGKPAAMLVTDPAERAKAKPLVIRNPNEGADDEGWTGEGN